MAAIHQNRQAVAVFLVSPGRSEVPACHRAVRVLFQSDQILLAAHGAQGREGRKGGCMA